jgi:hypothetical protein
VPRRTLCCIARAIMAASWANFSCIAKGVRGTPLATPSACSHDFGNSATSFACQLSALRPTRCWAGPFSVSAKLTLRCNRAISRCVVVSESSGYKRCPCFKIKTLETLQPNVTDLTDLIPKKCHYLRGQGHGRADGAMSFGAHPKNRRHICNRSRRALLPATRGPVRIFQSPSRPRLRKTWKQQTPDRKPWPGSHIVT